MFRHERPQKGRQRQFHQIGIELIGVLGGLPYQLDSRLDNPADGSVFNPLDDLDAYELYVEHVAAHFRGRIDTWESWHEPNVAESWGALPNPKDYVAVLRAQAQPKEGLTVNFLYYQFSLDQPSALGVTHDNWGDEFNFAVDWEASDQLYVIGMLGVLKPGTAAEDWTGGSGDWLQAMLYLSWSW